MQTGRVGQSQGFGVQPDDAEEAKAKNRGQDLPVLELEPDQSGQVRSGNEEPAEQQADDRGGGQEPGPQPVPFLDASHHQGRETRIGELGFGQQIA